ncbi:MAG: hypothetical protein QOG59_2501, partial [Solirubrobacteraceae bacterium]|nr:hypothetical protein [Solirubrobacteraceae bacterium]
AIGAVIAAGTLSKLTYAGLLPGVGLGLILLGYRALPDGRRRALGMLALAGVVALAPVALYALFNVAVWHRGGGITAGGLAAATAGKAASGVAVTLPERLDYIWELYLPRLPFMHHTFFRGYPLANLWLDGSIGRFGWFDYGFPQWVYTVGRSVFAVLVALALVGAFRLRTGIRRLWPIFGCFAVMAAGLLGAIGYAGVRYRLSTGSQFEQARYLFPLLVLYALFTVLAAHGAGRRWSRTLGVALVLLAMAHGLFAETLTISRYYG